MAPSPKDPFFAEALYRDVIAASRSLGLPRHVREDIAHEAYIHLWTRVDEIAFFSKGLARLTVKQQAANQLRHAAALKRGGGHDHVSCSQVDLWLETDKLDPEASLLLAYNRLVERRMLGRLLRALNQEQRKIVILRSKGFATAEIADRLGISASAVRGRYIRALEALQAMFEAEEN